MPVISSPTRSWYSSNIMSRSASRMRWRITCLAVWAAMRPKSSGVTSRSSIWSRYSASISWGSSGSSGSRSSPVSGSTVGSSSASSASSSSFSSSSSGQQQLEDLEVAGVVVDVHARVLGRAGALLVRREERVLQGVHERVGGDSLLLLEHVDCVDDLLAHAAPSSALQQIAAADLRVRDGHERRLRVPATVTSSSVAPTSSPVKLLWPSRGSRVRTRARRPRKRRKWSGLVSGRSGPGDDTSSE